MSDRWKSFAKKTFMVLPVVLWLGATGGLLFQGAAAADDSKCSALPTNASQGLSAPAAREKQVRLSPYGSGVETVVFGRMLTEKTRLYEFTAEAVVPGSQSLATRVSPFISNEGAKDLPADVVTASAEVQGTAVLVTVVIRRETKLRGLAGSYAGTISVVDGRVSRLDIPLTVTFSSSVWQLPAAAVVITLLPGWIWVWLQKEMLSKKSQGGNMNLSLQNLLEYATSRGGIVALLVGAVAAAGVYLTKYLQSPTWGGDLPPSLAGIAVTAFVAFTTAATGAASLAEDRRRSGE